MTTNTKLNGNNTPKTVKMQVKTVGNARALNAPTTCIEAVEMVRVSEIIENFTPFDVENGYVFTGKGYYSLFGHGNGIKALGNIATNAQIDAALATGCTTVNQLVHSFTVPSRNVDRCNDNDYHLRPETSWVHHDGKNLNRVLEHLLFLAGKPNGKNSLQKRLLNVVPDASIEQLNDIAMMIHHIVAPMLINAEAKYNKLTGKKTRKYSKFVNANKLGNQFRSLSELNQ